MNHDTKKKLQLILSQVDAEELRRELEELEAVKNEIPVDWKKTRSKETGRGEDKRTVEVPYACIENTEALIKHHNIVIKYNEMSKNMDIDIPPGIGLPHPDLKENDALVMIHDLCAHHDYRISKDALDSQLSTIGSLNAYHPVREWIDSAEWDGVDRLPDFYGTVQEREDTEVKELLMRKWALNAVAAVFRHGGLRPQGALIFEGQQGLGKTMWLEKIAGDKTWVQDGIQLNVSDKDSVLECVSHWMVELGELAATFTKSDIQALKGFITKDKDRIRPAYARKTNEYARRTVFFGTVDERRFLIDQNGNRRFWIISVDKINVKTSFNAQQFWAQMKMLFMAGEPWWLTHEEIDMVNKYNEMYMLVDPIHERLDACVMKDSEDLRELNCTEILEATGMKNPSRSDTNKVGTWLRKNGYHVNSRTNRYRIAVQEMDRVVTVY